MRHLGFFLGWVSAALFGVYLYYLSLSYFQHKHKCVIYNDVSEPVKNNNKSTVFEYPIFFVTFNSKHESQALTRIQEEAKTFYNFERVYGFNANSLLQDEAFSNAHMNFIQNNRRGYGYWIWKPFLISKVMHQIPDGAFIVHVDSGCTLSNEGKQRFKEYLALMDYFNTDILCFQMHPHLEKTWSKKDTVLFLNASETDLNSGQIIGGVNIWRKSDFSLTFLKLWLDTMTADNYHYVDDTPSKEPNDPSFKEHRHDQSIFSLLIKTIAKEKAYVINHDETWSDNWDSIKHIPIHAIRWNN